MAEEILTVFKYETQQAIANIKNLREEVEKNEQAENELSKTTEEAQKRRLKLIQEEIDDLKELRKRRDDLKDSGAFNAKEISEYNARINETIARINQLAFSLGLAESDTKELAKAAAELSRQIEKQSKATEGLGESTKNATKAHKDLEKVADHVFKLLDELTFGVAGRLREAYKQVIALSKSFGVLKSALIASGIGVVVLALSTLIGAMKLTEKGATAVKNVTTGMSAAWERWVLNISNGSVSLKFNILAMAAAYMSAVKLREAFKKLADQQRELDVRYAQSREKLALLNNTLSDSSRSEQVRIAAGNKALVLEFRLLREREKQAKQMIELSRMAVAQAKGLEREEEAKDKLAEAEINLARIREESINMQTILERRIAAVRDEVAAKRRRELEEARQRELEALELRKKLIEQEANERLIVLERLFNQGVIKEDDYKNAVIKINLRKLEELQKLEEKGAIDFQNIELEKLRLERELQQNIIEAQKAAKNLAIQLVEDQAKDELLKIEELNQQKALTEEAYNNAVLRVNLSRIDKLISLETEGTTRYMELTVERLRIQSEFAAKSIEIQRKELEEKRNNIEDSASIELLREEQKFLKKEQSEQEYLSNSLSINQQRLDSLLELEEQGTKRYEEILTEKLRIDQEYAEKVQELEDQIREKREETAQNVLDSATELSTSLLDIGVQTAEANIEAAEKQIEIDARGHEFRMELLQKQLESAKGADRAVVESAIRAEQDQYELSQRQTERQIQEEKKRVATFKRAQLAVMAIQEAVALARAFAELGPVAGTVAAAALAIKFALLFAQAEEAEFAKGTESVPLGKNKPGRDTVPARLTAGEAVIPVRENKQRPGMAKAWISGTLDQYIESNYVWPKLREYIALQQKNSSRMSAISSGKSIGETGISAVLNDGKIVAGLRSLGRDTRRNDNKNTDRLINTIERTKNRKRGVA